MDEYLCRLYLEIDKKASKLSKIKGNDATSMLHLKKIIKNGGYEVYNWLKDFKSASHAALPDSLLSEYIKVLSQENIIPKKIPREIDRYKFILYAWIQNSWKEYGPVLTNTQFLKPTSYEDYDNEFICEKDTKKLIHKLSHRIYNGNLSLQDACNIIASIEQKKGTTITYVCFYSFPQNTRNCLLLTCLKKIKKKHKVYIECVSSQNFFDFEKVDFLEDFSNCLSLCNEFDFL